MTLCICLCAGVCLTVVSSIPGPTQTCVAGNTIYTCTTILTWITFTLISIWYKQDHKNIYLLFPWVSSFWLTFNPIELVKHYSKPLYLQHIWGWSPCADQSWSEYQGLWIWLAFGWSLIQAFLQGCMYSRIWSSQSIHTMLDIKI